MSLYIYEYAHWSKISVNDIVGMKILKTHKDSGTLVSMMIVLVWNVEDCLFFAHQLLNEFITLFPFEVLHDMSPLEKQ